MAIKTKIEWADHTASPWHGCQEVHIGCDMCYARTMAKRNPAVLGVWGAEGTRVRSKSFDANCRKWNAKAKEAGVRQSVFPSICDPFEDRPELVPWREAMFVTIDACPWLDFYLLTKRPENVRRMCPRTHGKPADQTADVGEGIETAKYWYRENVWLLTSISDQDTADAMIPELAKCRDLVPVLGVSAEPLLGTINLDCFLWDATGDCKPFRVPGISWVIVGGESGHGARPCDMAWIRDILKQCKASDVPCFVKQLGSHTIGPDPDSIIGIFDKKGGAMEEWPEDLQVREYPKL